MKKIGVIVARFQVPSLHEGHLHLLTSTAREVDVLIVVLGYKVNQPDSKNPLSLSVRTAMVKQAFKKHCNPNAKLIVLSLQDHPLSNEAWSQELDLLIGEEVVRLEQETQETFAVCLYGSRDSFIRYYHGLYQHQVIDEIEAISGTKVREQVKSRDPESFGDQEREGMVYALTTLYKTGMAVVDIAVYKEEYGEKYVLLGRKKRETQYRFIGGFFDPEVDNSLEDSALRELREEAGDDLVVDSLSYCMSHKIDDWRYRDNDHKIVSALFLAKYRHGEVTPLDDIEALAWHKLTHELPEKVVANHRLFAEKIAGMLL